jgi:hypothetical protein
LIIIILWLVSIIFRTASSLEWWIEKTKTWLQMQCAMRIVISRRILEGGRATWEDPLDVSSTALTETRYKEFREKAPVKDP